MRILFLIFISVIVITVFAGCTLPSAPQPAGPGPVPTTPPAESGTPLPTPVSSGPSLEICLNSRYSEHNPVGTASEQQVGDVLWAAGKAPLTGASRDIYVATPNGTYLYDPVGNSLGAYSKDKRDKGAFVMSFERELAFDAGLCYMPAILAGVSQWSTSGPSISISSCPMRSKLYFGVQEVKGLTSELVVHCSLPQTDEGWLPDPKTTGDDNIEMVLANLKYTNSFDQTNLTRDQISQLLWAGYGCTAHEVAFNRNGLTVPSAIANYYLTGTIYLVNENGVYRYQNRNPENNFSTRDHRLEKIKSGDVRGTLESAVSDLNQAPCYVVLCLKSKDAGQEYAQLEAGFVAGNMLMQATAMDLGCHFKTKLTQSELQSISTVTGIPTSQVPQAIVSLGKTPLK
jgi:hypothetical protein